MTRTIKFRGKDIKTGEWVYGDILHAQNYDPNTRTATKSENLIIVTGEVGERSYVADIIPNTLGQFTGLHDKNGKEIYEGDILRICKRHGGSKEEVRWHRDGFYIDEDALGWIYLRKLEYQPQVIGNIHDNPELLKGGEEWL